MNRPWDVYYVNEIGGLSRPEIIEFLYAIQGSVCAICRRYMRFADASIDHVIPRSRGGAHDPDNWVLAHRDCNTAKADRWPTIDELSRLAKLQRKVRRALLRMRLRAFLARVFR